MMQHHRELGFMLITLGINSYKKWVGEKRDLAAEEACWKADEDRLRIDYELCMLRECQAEYEVDMNCTLQQERRQNKELQRQYVLHPPRRSVIFCRVSAGKFKFCNYRICIGMGLINGIQCLGVNLELIISV